MIKWIKLSICVFLCAVSCVYLMLTVSLDCPFLIAPSVFSNVYLPTGKARNETISTMPERSNQCTIMTYEPFIIEHNLNLFRIKWIISFLKRFDSLLTYCLLCRWHVGQQQRSSISVCLLPSFRLSPRYCSWSSSFLLQYASVCFSACHACNFLLESNVVQS